MSCITSNDCFGDPCVNGTCMCGDNPYLSDMLDNCAKGVDAFRYLGLYPYVLTYLIFFTSLYGLGFLLSSYVTVRTIVAKRSFNLNLSMLASVMVALAFLVRAIYFGGDPHGLYGTYSPLGGRLCFSLFYDFMFGSYSFILMMWVKLCGSGISQKTSTYLSKIKIAIIILNVLLYIFEIGMCIYQSYNSIVNIEFSVFYTSYIGLLIVIFAACHIHFGRMFLSIIMEDQFYENESKKELARKVTILTVGCSCLFIVGVITQIISLGVSLVSNSNQMLLAKETIVRVVELSIGYSILFSLNYRLSHNHGSDSTHLRDPNQDKRRSQLKDSKVKLDLEIPLDAEKAIQSINSDSQNS